MRKINDYLPNKHPSKRPLPAPPPNPAPVQDDDFNYPPAKLSDVDTTHPDMMGLVNCVRRWAQGIRNGDGKSIVMVGPNGTGKTLISRVILWSLVDTVPELGYESPAGTMRPAAWILEKLKGGVHPGKIIRSRGGIHTRKIPFVIVDDIGSEHDAKIGADWETAKVRTQWAKLIDHCYIHHVPMILSGSNNAGTLADLAHHIGPRGWDRLLEMAPKGYMWDLSSVPKRRKAKGGRS